MISDTGYKDDYPSCAETHATFRVFHEDRDPDEVSRNLGIRPSAMQRRGEPVRAFPDGRVPALINGWFLSSERDIRSKDLRRHLDWFAETLGPLRSALGALRNQGWHMDIHCYWASEFSHGGPTLSPSQMKRLAELDLELWMDVYFVTDSPEDEAG